MIISQTIDIEIQIYKIITLPNKKSNLANNNTPTKEPEFWDILVKGYPYGSNSDDHFILIEINNIETKENLKKILKTLNELFPNATIENI